MEFLADISYFTKLATSHTWNMQKEVTIASIIIITKIKSFLDIIIQFSHQDIPWDNHIINQIVPKMISYYTLIQWILKEILSKSNNCFKATRLCSRLISIVSMTSLGCLRQKPSSFENFGCRYSTAFASISSNQNRGSFDLEELGPSMWYRSMWKRKSCFVQKAMFLQAKRWKASEGRTNSHD